MEEINLNIIDRIFSIKIGLETNTINQILILNNIINILHKIDNYDLITIENHINYFYQNNPENGITKSIIELNLDQLINYNSFNSIVNNWSNNSLPEYSELNDDTDSDFTDETVGEDDNYLDDNSELNNLSIDVPNLFGNDTSSLLSLTNDINRLFQNRGTTLSYTFTFDTFGNTDNLEDVPNVINSDVLNSLEVKKYYELDDELKNNNTRDSITLEEFKDDDEVRVLPCNHVFLKDSIDHWLTQNSHKCPVCRNSAGDHHPLLNQ